MKLPRQWRLRKGCEKTLSVKPNTIQPDRVMSSATKRPGASCQLKKDTWQKKTQSTDTFTSEIQLHVGISRHLDKHSFCLRRFTSWRQSKLLCRVLFLFWHLCQMLLASNFWNWSSIFSLAGNQIYIFAEKQAPFSAYTSHFCCHARTRTLSLSLSRLIAHARSLSHSHSCSGRMNVHLRPDWETAPHPNTSVCLKVLLNALSICLFLSVHKVQHSLGCLGQTLQLHGRDGDGGAGDDEGNLGLQCTATGSNRWKPLQVDEIIFEKLNDVDCEAFNARVRVSREILRVSD